MSERKLTISKEETKTEVIIKIQVEHLSINDLIEMADDLNQHILEKMLERNSKT